jgi:hypothetical protein
VEIRGLAMEIHDRWRLGWRGDIVGLGEDSGIGLGEDHDADEVQGWPKRGEGSHR